MTRRRVLAPAWKPVGRWVDGTLRPLETVPWVAMGDVRLGQVDASELERGHVYTDQVTGTSCVRPDTAPLNRLPFTPSRYASGFRGVPLPSERPFRVVPSSASPSLEPTVDAPPATNLTKVFPQLFAPGKGGGERPQTVANVPVTVGAGATTVLIQLPELPRGMSAVVKEFGQTAADFTNLFWSFFIKGRPVDPIVGINFQFGLLNDPHRLPGTGVELGPGDDFVVQVTNTGGAAVAGVRARVDLYQYQLFGGGAA